MNDAIQEITRFQTDRELDKKEFNWLNEATNIVEELLEALGYDVPKTRRPELSTIIDGMVIRAQQQGVATRESAAVKSVSIVDAFGDIIVFACGALTKLGYDPEKVLDEVAKEINSREGEMIDGKFEKYLTQEAKDKWYKADFTRCKLDKIGRRQRNAFFMTEGYTGTDQEIEKWIRDMASPFLDSDQK